MTADQRARIGHRVKKLETTDFPRSARLSAVGGSTPGETFCITYSSSATEIPMGRWVFLAMTYNGRESRVYMNGRLDALEHYNPFPYADGLLDGDADGADFTVGAELGVISSAAGSGDSRSSDGH